MKVKGHTKGCVISHIPIPLSSCSCHLQFKELHEAISKANRYEYYGQGILQVTWRVPETGKIVATGISDQPELNEIYLDNSYEPIFIDEDAETLLALGIGSDDTDSKNGEVKMSIKTPEEYEFRCAQAKLLAGDYEGLRNCRYQDALKLFGLKMADGDNVDVSQYPESGPQTVLPPVYEDGGLYLDCYREEAKLVWIDGPLLEINLSINKELRVFYSHLAKRYVSKPSELLQITRKLNNDFRANRQLIEKSSCHKKADSRLWYSRVISVGSMALAALKKLVGITERV